MAADSDTKHGWQFFALTVLAIVSLGATALTIRTLKFADQQLTFLLIGGIVSFLIVLALFVSVFKRLNLTDSRFALALPDGSIRAIIALALLLLFGLLVLTIYFAENGPPGQTGEIAGVTAAQVNAIPIDQLISAKRETDGTFTVVRAIESSQTADNLAKQVVTTVSTLVVAIASFYFGSSSIASVTSNASANPIGLRNPPVNPTGPPAGGGKAPVAGQ